MRVKVQRSQSDDHQWYGKLLCWSTNGKYAWIEPENQAQHQSGMPHIVHKDHITVAKTEGWVPIWKWTGTSVPTCPYPSTGYIYPAKELAEAVTRAGVYWEKIGVSKVEY